MSFWMEWKRKMSNLSRGPGFDAGLDEEIVFHLEARAEELERQGMSRTRAMEQARREFGTSLRMREDSRAAWQFRWVEDLLSDLRYALRALSRNPGFAATGIISLALGIGANTTIFSLTNEFLFGRPSVRNPETLVALRIGGNSHSPLSAYRFVRDSKAFAGLAGELEEAEVNWRDGDRSSRLHVMRVTDNFFDVIGVPLALGRTIQPGEPRVTVVSDNFWREHLSGDPGALGRKLILDGAVYSVVGVLPENHRTLVGFGFAPDLYVPVEGEDSIVAFYARLSDGMTHRAALDRLAMVARDLDRAEPRGGGNKWNSNLQISAISGLEWLNTMGAMPIAGFFAMLMIVVALVLLVACANVASLLLARASSRSQELAIRLSIGASRNRIVRHLLAESLLMGLLGTAAGLVLNLWLTTAMNHVQLPLPIPIRLQIQPDTRLLAYSAALALVTALVSGLMPSLKASRADVTSVLKQSEHQVSGRRWGLRNVLVAGQLAVSILLLTTGLLFLRNLLKSTTMSPGFDVQRTALARMRLVPEKYTTREQGDQVVRSALDALRALPGVEAASVAEIVPLNGNMHSGQSLKTDLNNEPRHNEFTDNYVTPQYFQTMGIPIVRGREFEEGDRAGGASVVILNQAFARRLFGAVNPVGHWIQFADGQRATVIGLAKNSKYFMLSEDEKSAIYSPLTRKPGLLTDLNFLIRARAHPDALAAPVNAILNHLDSSAVVEFKPMRDALGFALLPSRVGALLLGSMGFLGLTLAAVGLYGVLVYAIARRTREIGLRIAFGATPADVLRLVFRESVLLAGTGTLIGVGAALLVTRPLKAFLVPGLSSADPLSYALVLAALGVVVLAATLAPAIRALRVDPLTAIHYQ